MLAPYTPLISLRSAVLDIETTGLDLAAARAIQIAALQLTGAQFEDQIFETLVDPEVPIPSASQRIHGIRDEDVQGAPRFAQVFPRLEAIIHGRALIGYNTGFDIAILEKECRLAGLTWTRPRFLCVQALARVVSQHIADDSLEALANWLGVEIKDRHTALGDARASAEIYLKLLPLLREKGVRTLAEAEEASRTQLEKAARLHAANGGLSTPPSAVPAEPEGQPDPIFLELDSYPYRHRMRNLMRPAVFVEPDLGLAEAAQIMIDRKISALLVTGNEGPGIVTERDLLWSLAEQARGEAAKTVGDIASRPLQTVSEDDFVYRAIGRMDRLRIRHLGVVDQTDRITGIVSARSLLRQRATAAIALGDEIDRAPDVAALGLARAKLAPVGRSLMKEGIEARDVAQVISAELCAMNARAAAMAEEWMEAKGKGAPPCPYAFLVLGSAGRGESLLSADQDNALVFAEGEPGGPEDRWFAAFAAKASEILDEAGIPFCKGGVMASNPAWRHSASGWRATAESWIGRSNPQDILDVDIFFDARVVHGDRALGAGIIHHAWACASDAPDFLKLLGENARRLPPAFTLWGGFRTDELGRLDVKRHGLMPIFTGARLLALRHGVRARSTPERLEAVKGMRGLADGDLNALISAHAILLDAVLRQQLRDISRGIPPSARVEIAQLSESERRELKRALQAATLIGELVGEGLVA